MTEKEQKLGLTGEEVEKENRPGGDISGLFKAMGDSECDAEGIAASDTGKAMAQNMSLMGLDDKATAEFWRNYEKGLIKELHGDPDEQLTQWASYIPVAAESDKARKFPLIFCLHGANNPIKLTESYGVMQMAAREECIVIAPENEELDNILSLLEYAKVHYPVDVSRVYSIGYSYGGFMTSRNAMARPDIFAGVGMGGMLFATDIPASEVGGQMHPAYKLTDEMLDNARELELPALLFMGENEMLHLEPLWREPEGGPVRDGAIPLMPDDKHRSFNNWRYVGGCGRTEFKAPEFYENSADPTVKSVGAEFEHTEVREYLDRKYFIGDSVNGSGETLFRTVSCEGMCHWPTPAYAELAWEHIGKYARDPETKKLIRL